MAATTVKKKLQEAHGGEGGGRRVSRPRYLLRLRRRRGFIEPHSRPLHQRCKQRLSKRSVYLFITPRREERDGRIRREEGLLFVI